LIQFDTDCDTLIHIEADWGRGGVGTWASLTAFQQPYQRSPTQPLSGLPDHLVLAIDSHFTRINLHLAITAKACGQQWL
jgi:hypothetical protein